MILVLVVLGLAIEYWYVAVPVGVLLLMGAVVNAQAKTKRQEEQALAEAARAREAETQRLAARKAWLAGPPPPLIPPGRFTETWFAEHVPGLHPGQVPMLLAALRSRGWTDAKIEERLAHHLARNEFWRPA